MARTRFSVNDKWLIAKAQNQVDLMYRGHVICPVCRRSFPIDIMEVDHIKPVSKGGKDNPTNLRLLCPSCNKKKGAKKISTTNKREKSPWDKDFWY